MACDLYLIEEKFVRFLFIFVAYADQNNFQLKSELYSNIFQTHTNHVILVIVGNNTTALFL